MFSLMTRVFIVSLLFSKSLATKRLSLNDESCMVRPNLIVHPCFNIIQDINIKVFSVITNNNEVKTMAKHISCDYKYKFNSTTCHSNQKWNDKTCQCECKKFRKCKRDYSWNPSTCIC